jgi:hypothetical protein
MDAKSPYWVNNIYGLGYWLKDYGYFPKNWSLQCYMDHGALIDDVVYPHEIENMAPVMFRFSPRAVINFKNASNKPVYCVMNPTIHCRRVRKYEKNPEATRSLFFVAHSTPEIDDTTNWDKFISNLSLIPDDFKPLDICMHYHDINKGLDVIFRKRGYNVYTAGDPLRFEFADDMYKLLMKYKYTLSNVPGSYLPYSVEMGIPFSLFGEAPKYFNNGDLNVEAGDFNSYLVEPTYQKALRLFAGFQRSISPKQKEFVGLELGINDSISRLKTALILYRYSLASNILFVIKGSKNSLSNYFGTAKFFNTKQKNLKP